MVQPRLNHGRSNPRWDTIRPLGDVGTERVRATPSRSLQAEAGPSDKTLKLETSLLANEGCNVNNRLVYHVAPNKALKEWAVIKEGASQPRKKGLSKEQAVRAARRIVEKKARPAVVLIHKTRYIIERQLQFSA